VCACGYTKLVSYRLDSSLLSLSLSLSLCPLVHPSFTRVFLRTTTQLLVSTPYKLQLTLEVLKLHRVISVSGIQGSRVDCEGYIIARTRRQG